MNCANHVDVPAVAYCRTCGKPVCSQCARDVRGVIYCEECLASHVSGTVPPPPPLGAVPPPVVVNAPSPGLAAVLGFIPGVGAMYNGEYGKGFIHVLIFATLIWMTNNINDIFGIAIAAFVVYMPIEAYKTAKAREMGLEPPDPLGLNNMFSGSRTAKAAPVATAVPVTNPDGTVTPGVVQTMPAEPESPQSKVPLGAVILIGLGVLFLLNELNLLHFDWVWRFWPLILIAVGIRIMMKRQGRG